MKYGKKKPMRRYRFKDGMGYVVFRSFYSDREARLWFEKHKSEYYLKEIASMEANMNRW